MALVLGAFYVDHNSFSFSASVTGNAFRQVQGGYEVTSQAPDEQGQIVTIMRMCPQQTMCVAADGTCVAVGTVASGLTCGSDNNWGYATTSTFSNGAVNQGVCQQRDMCVRFNGECVVQGTLNGQLTCGPNHTWGYAIASYVPNEDRNRPAARHGFCPPAQGRGSNQCLKLDGTCVAAGTVVSGLTCGFDNNWGYAIQSYVPDEDRTAPAGRKGICQQANQCVNSVQVCLNLGTVERGYICGSDHNWAYAIQSYFPGENIGLPSLHKAACPQQAMCVDTVNGCQPLNTLINGLTCSANHNWGYAVRSVMPGVSALQEGVCARQNQCLVDMGAGTYICRDVGQFYLPNSPLKCGAGNNWLIKTQSYGPGELRTVPAARHGVCQKQDQCVALDGTCYDTGQIVSNLACYNSNWLGCGPYHSMEPQADVATWGSNTVNGILDSFTPSEFVSSVGEYDVVGGEGANAVCRGGRFQPVLCRYEHLITADVFIDTTFIDVPDSVIRETFNRASMYLCSQTPNQNYGYQVRNIYHARFPDQYRGGTENDFIRQWYADHNTYFPEAFFWFSRVHSAGVSWPIIDESNQFCNRYVQPTSNPDHPRGQNAFAFIGVNVDFMQGRSSDAIQRWFLTGPTTRYGYGGGMNSLLSHEFLHRYGRGHEQYGYDYSPQCMDLFNTPSYRGRHADAAGICGNAIANLISGTQVCPLVAQNIRSIIDWNRVGLIKEEEVAHNHPGEDPVGHIIQVSDRLHDVGQNLQHIQLNPQAVAQIRR